MQRRDFLSDLSRYAAFCAIVPNVWRVTSRPRLADDPFLLGVASGDPTPTGGVLWTRLAPRPHEPESGMDGQRTVVTWELATDDTFKQIVKQGRATAAPELGYSIHVELEGLEPDRWYSYRFAAGGATSPVGRFRTAPLAGSATPLRFGVASCQHYEQGLFTAYEHMAREELDLITHLGDYIYEYAAAPGRVRAHNGLEIRSVEDYRRRYALYKADPALKAAHARCPWVVTWDDHEVDNNYAGIIGENGMESEEQVRARRAAGYQAWWENQPVRVPRVKSWSDLDITRTIEWGSTAKFWVMDSRQYRSDQACDDGNKVVPCGEWASQTRTLLGDRQEQWLARGLETSTSRWNVLANQIMVGPYDSAATGPQHVSMDQWSGYPAARDRLLRTIARRSPNRTVVLTGDIHSSWVNELRTDFQRPEQAAIAAEFVGTSISSGGDGSDGSDVGTEQQRSRNPHIKWQHKRRGYMTCSVDADGWSTDFRSVPFVTKPGAPIETATRWKLARGRPGIERLS